MMKRRTCAAFTAGLMGLSGIAAGQADLKKDPAYLDIESAINLTEVKPEVHINVPKFLMNSILSDVKNVPAPLKGLDDRLLKLLKDVKLIRLMVFSGEVAKSEQLKGGADNLRQSLQKDWTPILNVSSENLFLYARSDESGEKIGGMAFMAVGRNEVVIGNIVGHIPLGEALILAAELGNEDFGKIMEEVLGGKEAPPSLPVDQVDPYDESE